MIPENASEQSRAGASPAPASAASGKAGRRDPYPALKSLLLTVVVAVIYVLHQDFWNWKKAFPLVLGFLPIGLAYQAGYSILAAAMMALLVRTAWPKHLEDVEPESSGPQGNRS